MDELHRESVNSQGDECTVQDPRTCLLHGANGQYNTLRPAEPVSDYNDNINGNNRTILPRTPIQSDIYRHRHPRPVL